MSFSSEQTERYARHLLLREIGGQGQQKLSNAKVLVVGAGGIGNPALLYLAAAGIGHIGIVDDDHVSLSNLHRQVLFSGEDIGQSKAHQAATVLKTHNPDPEININQTRLDADNAEELIAQYDWILDGVDNFETRFALNRAALAQKKSWISTAVGQFSGQLLTFKPHLAPGILPCYRCLVPEIPPIEDQFRCDRDGIPGPLTGIMGTLATMELIKEIAGFGESLAGHMLIYDALTTSFRRVRLPADPHCPDCGSGQ